MTDPADPLRRTFAQARRDLTAALIDRDDEIDLALTALVAGEYLLLVGPPGTAKSLLLDAGLGQCVPRPASVRPLPGRQPRLGSEVVRFAIGPPDDMPRVPKDRRQLADDESTPAERISGRPLPCDGVPRGGQPERTR